MHGVHPPGAAQATMVARYGDAIAEGRALPASLAWRDGSWRTRGWSDLDDHVQRIAAGLIELGIAAGDRVALLSTTREEWTWSDYAAQLAGAVVVPVYPSNIPPEVLHVLRDAGAVAVICEDAEQAAKVEAVRADLPDLRHVISFVPAPGALALSELEGRGTERLAREPESVAARSAQVGPDDVCTIIYTSGTTGPPKGCVVTHANFAAMLEMVPRGVIGRSDDLMYLYLPLAHAFARLVGFVALRDAVTLAYTRGLDRIAEDLVEVSPTILPSVPRVFEKAHAAVLARRAAASAPRQRLFDWALRVGGRATDDRIAGRTPGGLALALADRLVLAKVRARFGGRVRMLFSGGAPISGQILEFFWACGLEVYEGYGLTETSTAAALNLPGAVRLGTVGRPFTGMEARIADDGEILLRGANVFAGYFGQPDATAEVLVDGWLRSGDIGSLEDGYLRITDRKKDIIVTAGGKNVTPANLENALRESPFIAEACVLGDRRPYLVCLVTVEVPALEDWASANGVAARGPELRRDPAVLRLVQAEVDRVNSEHARVEQIRRFEILDADFSQETGELTPTLKLKRRVVAERYAAVLDALYASPAGISGGS